MLGSGRGAQEQRRVGAPEAARDDERDIAARRLRLRRYRDAGEARVRGAQGCDAGNRAPTQRLEREHAIEHAGGREQVSEGPLA